MLTTACFDSYDSFNERLNHLQSVATASEMPSKKTEGNNAEFALTLHVLTIG